MYDDVDGYYDDMDGDMHDGGDGYYEVVVTDGVNGGEEVSVRASDGRRAVTVISMMGVVYVEVEGQRVVVGEEAVPLLLEALRRWRDAGA